MSFPPSVLSCAFFHAHPISPLESPSFLFSLSRFASLPATTSQNMLKAIFSLEVSGWLKSRSKQQTLIYLQSELIVSWEKCSLLSRTVQKDWIQLLNYDKTVCFILKKNILPSSCGPNLDMTQSNKIFKHHMQTVWSIKNKFSFSESSRWN